MSEELKPCAHCGGEAKFERSISEATIRCTECGIRVSKNVHPGIHRSWREQEDAENKMAFAAWNRRHQEQDQSSTFERMMSK